MTARGLVLSDPAFADLRDICEYIVERDPGVAHHVLEDIRASIHRLVELPHLGHVRTDLADEDLHVWKVHT